MTHNETSLFDLTGRVAVITGGAGLLGTAHAATLAAAGAIPILVDLDGERAEAAARDLRQKYQVEARSFQADICRSNQLQDVLRRVLVEFERVDILINNAAKNPRVEDATAKGWSRFESMTLEQWHVDLEVGLTGAFLCCQVFGAEMVRRGKGSIINIASIYGIIAPDQRLYREEGVEPEAQPVKPVSYSVVKTGILGLTTYLAAYWAEAGIRVNSISPGGILSGQPEGPLRRLCDVVPMGRLGRREELAGAVVYLCSDASSYVTGTNMVIDGGRCIW